MLKACSFQFVGDDTSFHCILAFIIPARNSFGLLCRVGRKAIYAKDSRDAERERDCIFCQAAKAKSGTTKRVLTSIDSEKVISREGQAQGGAKKCTP